jgi:hypothetical protein
VPGKASSGLCSEGLKYLPRQTGFMDEVDADPIHHALEMSEFVQRRFLLAPVMTVLPVGDKFPEVV